MSGWVGRLCRYNPVPSLYLSPSFLTPHPCPLYLFSSLSYTRAPFFLSTTSFLTSMQLEPISGETGSRRTIWSQNDWSISSLVFFENRSSNKSDTEWESERERERERERGREHSVTLCSTVLSSPFSRAGTVSGRVIVCSGGVQRTNISWIRLRCQTWSYSACGMALPSWLYRTTG